MTDDNYQYNHIKKIPLSIEIAVLVGVMAPIIFLSENFSKTETNYQERYETKTEEKILDSKMINPFDLSIDEALKIIANRPSPEKFYSPRSDERQYFDK